MKKSYIIRTIFWGIISFILLTAGITGILYSNKIFNERKTELESIISIFNASEVIENYKKVNTNILAELDGKNIKITYKGLDTIKYTYKLKNGYLETKLNKTDTVGKNLLMILTDSIAIKHGMLEGSTYPLFHNDDILNYKFTSGIEFNIKNNIYTVKINLDGYVYNNNYNNNEDENNNENENKPLLN